MFTPGLKTIVPMNMVQKSLYPKHTPLKSRSRIPVRHRYRQSNYVGSSNIGKPSIAGMNSIYYLENSHS